MIKKFLFIIIIIAILGGGYFYFYLKRSASDDYDVARKIFQEEMAEARITASVKAALSLNKNFKFFDIKVKTDEGVVTLNGVLPRKEMKELALEIANNVIGVERVVDDIRIDPSVAEQYGSNDVRTFGEGIDDAAITANVKASIALNKKLERSKIKISTFKRVVFLEGTVLNEDQKDLAITVALGVDNVRDVKTDLIIKK